MTTETIILLPFSLAVLALLLGLGLANALRWRHEAGHWRRRYEDLTRSNEWAAKAMREKQDGKVHGDLN
jgi:hypothetical protein